MKQSEITWQWLLFDELSPYQMQAMFALRQSIFIVEQNCPYPDIDGKDAQAHHLLGWFDDKLVATLRVFESYKEYQGNASIGRICTAQSARRLGLGKIIVDKASEFINNHFSNKPTQIGAQFYLKRFYQELGFKQISEVYDEDGIEHILMLKESSD